MEELMKGRPVVLSLKTFSFFINGLLLVLAIPGMTQAITVPASIESLTSEASIPLPVYQWLAKQQNITTGLLPSQQDTRANTYNNALAVMVFTLKGDKAKAGRILSYFNSGANEFFDGRCNSFSFPCSSNDPCDEFNHCGFFQLRNSTKIDGADTHSDRWMGDMAWLSMAINHYQAKFGDLKYSQMADAIIRLLISFQQPEGYIAGGWKWDSQKGKEIFNKDGHAEGNLDAYKALSLFSKPQAQQIKEWLDFNNLDWKKGPLDLHSWRVLALGKEYGFILPDTERTDDNTLRYRSTINYKSSMVSGFRPRPFTNPDCHMNNNIWTEGTGQMAVSLYKAGYKGRGDFYVGQLEKLLFQPYPINFPSIQALAFLALPDPACHPWADPTKGHVAGVSWYIFAKERFNPFEGVVINSFQVKNPIAKLEAENFDSYSSASAVRLDDRGILSEGRGIHLGGDNASPNNNSGWVEFRFNILTPITITAVDIRYADDVAGDAVKVFLDGNLIANFNTADTGTWNNYIVASLSVGPIQLQPGLHTFKVQVKDNGTYGLTIDYFNILF
jgi:hypothetical protein